MKYRSQEVTQLFLVCEFKQEVPDLEVNLVFNYNHQSGNAYPFFEIKSQTLVDWHIQRLSSKFRREKDCGLTEEQEALLDLLYYRWKPTYFTTSEKDCYYPDFYKSDDAVMRQYKIDNLKKLLDFLSFADDMLRDHHISCVVYGIQGAATLSDLKKIIRDEIRDRENESHSIEIFDSVEAFKKAAKAWSTMPDLILRTIGVYSHLFNLIEQTNIKNFSAMSVGAISKNKFYSKEMAEARKDILKIRFFNEEIAEFASQMSESRDFMNLLLSKYEHRMPIDCLISLKDLKRKIESIKESVITIKGCPFEDSEVMSFLNSEMEMNMRWTKHKSLNYELVPEAEQV